MVDDQIPEFWSRYSIDHRYGLPKITLTYPSVAVEALTMTDVGPSSSKRKASIAFLPDSFTSYLMGSLRDNFDHLKTHVQQDCAFVANKANAGQYTKKLLEELFRYLYLLADTSSDGVVRSSKEILTQNGVDMKKIRQIWPNIPFYNKEIDNQIEINAHYSGYLKKQKADILAFKRDENLLIPAIVDYDKLSGLSNEVKAKFKHIRPKTMGQALRIDGITPAAVYILLSHVKRKSIKHIA